MAPKIFTLLRCPVTGTSGGQPTRLQVVCRVESWRKLASSVPLPAILLISVGSGQHATRALHGEAQTMEQLAHMAWMIMNSEFLLDDPGDHGRGPDARIQTVGYRAAVENVVELFPLRRRQLQWPARAMSFEQPLHAKSLVAC